MRFASRLSAAFCVGLLLLVGASRTDAFPIYGVSLVSGENRLVRFDSTTPGTIDIDIPITGLQATELIQGIDFRPATAQLYALGVTGGVYRLYIINTTTGAATVVGSPGTLTLAGSNFGFDFDPVADRIRLVSNADENILINPNDGTASAEGALAYQTGDQNVGENPNVVGAAYRDLFPGVTSTLLYDIDVTLDILTIQSPPETGRLTTVGSLGVNTSFVIGFDIARNLGYASLRVNSVTGLYTISLGDGMATLVGTIGNGNPNLVDITVALEPQTFVVTSPADPGDGICNTTCTLREAITAANAKPGADIINFNIPGIGGTVTVTPTSVLPSVTDPVTIDGYSQPGASANTLVVGNNAVLRIQLSGTNAGDVPGGLVIKTSDCIVRGLVVNRWMNAGILIDGVTALGVTNNVIAGNFIGTNSAGSQALGNGDGVEITAPGNIVGGTTPAARNLISGNTSRGIIAGSTNNLIQGNYIGTDKTGAAGLGNGTAGIRPEGNGQQIGGAEPGAGNVISGNGSAGVLSAGNNHLIQGNLIGTNASGNASLSNQNGGVYINCGSNITIGGAVPGARNVISGNTGPDILNGNNVVVICGTNNRVLGNFIGTDAAGQADLGNPFGGVLIRSDGNFIGGSAPGEGNLISGNNIGVEIDGFGTTDNLVQGNAIGTTANGGPLGNGTGVWLRGGSTDTTVGGSGSAANTIAFSSGSGIAIQTSEGNDITGNSIFSNDQLGIDLKGGTQNTSFVTENDPLDGDTGPNRLQNYPVLTGINGSGSTRVLEGQLNSAANTAYVIDFYRNDAVDPSGFGEGQNFMGFVNVQTNAQGTATFSFPLDNSANGQFVTATATDLNGNTSEFSMASSIVPGPPPPTPTPSPTPTPTPGVVANVATRLPVGINDDVLIEGFIVLGPGGSTKKIMVRALGPFLTQFGVPDALANPTLEIRDSTNTLIASNNDWRNTEVGGIITGDQVAEIEASGLAPTNDLESAIIADLAPGNYTAVVRGLGDTTGTGIVDAYDLSPASPARLANIATRGLIQPGDQLMIAGFITQSGDVRAVIRAIGPSLSVFGITNALPDTTLQLRDVNGAIVRENDDWQSDQKTELEATGLQPGDTREAALVATIPPGQYTAQVRGKPESTGIGVVEVYFLQ